MFRHEANALGNRAGEKGVEVLPRETRNLRCRHSAASLQHRGFAEDLIGVVNKQVERGCALALLAFLGPGAAREINQRRSR